MHLPARNIELKARLADLNHARRIAERVATARVGIERQRDTYFVCTNGRLKLREIEGSSAQLIAYSRPDEPNAKASDYRLLTIAEANAATDLRELLAASLGVLVTVDKRREIFLYHNVRIHLDEVSGLGAFVEFEAVVGGAIDDAAACAQVDWLRQQFQIGADDLLSCSYGDMLTHKRAQP
jgi:predicted adenylyl cyclase CyaB